MNTKHEKKHSNQHDASSADNRDATPQQGPEICVSAEQATPRINKQLKLVPSNNSHSDKCSKKRMTPRLKKKRRGKADKAVASSKRLEEMNEAQLKTFTDRSALVNFIKHGVTVKEAIKRVGLDCTERTARNLVRRREEQGAVGLIDKRWSREPEAYVFTPEVMKLTLGWYFARPAAGYRAIWKKVCKECRRLRLTEPCETTIKNFLSNLEPAFKLFRKGKLGIREWEQTGKPVVRYDTTTYANELWQGDHSPCGFG